MENKTSPYLKSGAPVESGSSFIGHRAVFINGVTPLPDVLRCRQELVVRLGQFLLQRGVQFSLPRRDLGQANQVFELTGVLLVVEQQPGAVEVANVGVAKRADAAILPAAHFAGPLPKRRDATDQSCAVRRVLPT